MKRIPYVPDVPMITLTGEPLKGPDGDQQIARQFEYLAGLLSYEEFTKGLSGIDAMILASDTRKALEFQRETAHVSGWLLEDDPGDRLLAAAKVSTIDARIRPFIHNFADFAEAMRDMKKVSRAAVERPAPEDLEKA
jgi:hypothetical protein